jgi:methionyl-tRNA formyltransferase
MPNIIFMGTPPFAASILERLLDADIDVRAVVTQPPRPQKRSQKPIPSAVAEVATRAGLPLFEPEKVSTDEMVERLASFGADLFIVVAYGEILRRKVLEIPPLGCVNIHASLLPKYRGAAPIQRAIMEGEWETGVSIMYMVREMDAGDVIEVARTPIGPDEQLAEVEARLCELGGTTLLQVLSNFEKLSATPQDSSQITFAPKITTEECEIDWSRPPEQIHNLVRGVAGRPGAWCWVTHGGKKLRMKVHRTQLSDGKLQLLEVQLEGKKRMSEEELRRGFPKLEVVR